MRDSFIYVVRLYVITLTEYAGDKQSGLRSLRAGCEVAIATERSNGVKTNT